MFTIGSINQQKKKYNHFFNPVITKTDNDQKNFDAHLKLLKFHLSFAQFFVYNKAKGSWIILNCDQPLCCIVLIDN